MMDKREGWRERCNGCSFARPSKATDLGIGPWCSRFNEACVLVKNCYCRVFKVGDGQTGEEQA